MIASLKMRVLYLIILVNFRLLIANRRNYPLAIVRDNWKHRDANFSEKGIMIRCVSDDQVGKDFY